MTQNMDKKYHIAFCVDDIYAQYISVTIKSIAENFHIKGREGICIHIITDFISEKKLHRLNKIIKEYELLTLYIHKVDGSSLFELRTNGWGVYTWYRILLPNILSLGIDRVLYLDADTLVTADLSELFDMDMTNKSIAAVVEDNTFGQKHYNRLGYESSKHYICAGVLLMNLDYWREHHLTEKMIEWAKKNEYRIRLLDQDTINYICQDTKILLPLRFGIVQFFFMVDQFYESPYLCQLEECIRNPGIIHYAYCAPWYKDSARHIMHKEWIKYNRMLRYPVRQIYKAKGWLLIKIMFWDILHLFKGRGALTLEEVYAKIASKRQGFAKVCK